MLEKIGLCLNFSKIKEECSLARACKFYAAARMLGFSLKCAQNAVWDLIRVEEAQVA